LPLRPALKELLWLPIVLLGILVIYVPGLGNELVFDDAYLADGSLFEEYRRLQLRVRLLSYGSFVWVQGLFGDGWWKQRIVNLAIHAGVVVVLWALYREILRRIDPGEAADGTGTPAAPLDRSWALPIAIGFFAFNPVAVYAVAYLVQRSILLATFFVVLGLWLFARAAAGGKPWLYLAALAAYAVAVMSKEHAVLAPLVAVPVYIVVARPDRRRLAILAGATAGVLTLAAAGLYLRYGDVIGKPFDEYSQVYLDQLSRLDPDAGRHAYTLSILNQAWLFFRYGVDWMLPWSGWMSINLRPPFPVKIATFPHLLGIFGYVAAVAGGFWLLVRFRDWRALLGLALVIPALLFATEFTTVWVQDPFVLYRSYLWAIGIPAVVVLLVHGPPPRVHAAVAVVLASFLLWQAQDRVFSLATAERAWTDAIEKLPNDARSVGRWFPYLNRGSIYADRDDTTSALRDYEMSSRLGDLGMGAMNRGALLTAAGKNLEALKAFDEAQKQGYKLYNLPLQRGIALAALNRNEEAFRSFGDALALDAPSPSREVALLHVGRLGMLLQRHDEAIPALEALLVKDGKNREARYLLGMGLVAKGRHERAVEVLDPLIEVDRNPRAYYARALAHYNLRHKAQAQADIDMAVRLWPENANLREWQKRIAQLP
jgi:tetratricopeptide (TPR) repeat protein